MDVELTITENHDDITLEVSESGDEITLTVEETVEDVQITIVEGGGTVEEDYPTFISIEQAMLPVGSGGGGLAVGDKFYLANGNDIGVPGTLLKILG